MNKPFLSIVIPAYNEETRLPGSLEKIAVFLAQQSYRAEVLIVENGSSHRTYAIAQEFEQKNPIFHALHIDERGKGIAVKSGMLAAQGDYRFICDADLSMPIEEVTRFIPPVLEKFDIAIASREAPGAERIGEPAYRHFIGRVFNSFVKFMALPGLQDTQCGFKCFSAKAAEHLFPLQTIQGWTFDVEVLFLARKFGYSITEVPIRWYFNSHSKVRFLRDSLHMAGDLLRIRWKAFRKDYES
jgi:glycosyltransferase involved in cell wall biosynthesis